MIGDAETWLEIRKELAVAYGKQVPEGFLVRVGSTAMRNGSPKEKRSKHIRDQLVSEGILVPDEDPRLFRFSADYVFTSQSTAAGVVIDGNSNGSHWRASTRPIHDEVPNTFRLAREKVEEAMDAYDQFLSHAQHEDVFGRFNEPISLWVRSTRLRPNRVYPSKPINFWANGQQKVSGGWARSKAGASLHNSGFIIVDKSDKPVPVPADSPHLIRDSDHVRLCALNYYIEPARERFEKTVTIRAGSLHSEMGLNNAWANVCQSLKGKKFQDLAGVPPPIQDGPDQSTTTTFTYNLTQSGILPKMTIDVTINQSPTTNLILYGPPGTGKTYATAYEAVRLCLGEDLAASLANDRNALMAEYRTLVAKERIEFVTFHQSFSYEDFVEGLRPDTEKAGGDGEVNTTNVGFSLKVHDGVFKRISERARLDTGNSADQRLDRSKQIFKLSLTGSTRKADLEAALVQGEIYWSSGGEIDWTSDIYEDFEPVKQRWREDHPDADGRGADITGTFLFRSSLDIGDYVLLTSGYNRFVALGQVKGPYEYVATDGMPRHRRSIEWLWNDPEGRERSEFYPMKFSAWQPIYRLVSTEINWDALETTALGAIAERPLQSARPFVLIIDEINRANISKVFGELITLLETDKRLGRQNEVRLRLPYSGTTFGVPSNLHIVGTMNTADRSIALLDTALRRRFSFRELMPDPAKLDEDRDGINLRKLLTVLNDRIEYLFDRDHQIGHAYFTECKNRKDVEEVMRNRVIPLLSEYFYDDWSKVAAVLGDSSIEKKGRFLEARRLVVPPGLTNDEAGEPKVRWSVNSELDLSEFKAG